MSALKRPFRITMTIFEKTAEQLCLATSYLRSIADFQAGHQSGYTVMNFCINS